MASDTELWRGTDYGWWLAADTSGAVGASLIAFAVPLIMLATTGSSAVATTTESICVVVQTVLGLAGGVIQDRYDRRTLMLIWGASGVVLSAVAAAAVMLFGNAPKTSGHGVNGANAPAFGGPYAHVLPIALLCIVVLFSVRDGLLENTSNAMLRGVVPDEQLPHAMALNDARDSTVTLAGGPLGGLLMTVGHAVPFLTSAVLGGLSNTLVGKDKLGRVGAGSMVLQYGAYGVAVALAGWGMQTIGYGPTCLILATVLVAAAAYALTMRSLITLPTPDRWAEHIQRWGIAQF